MRLRSLGGSARLRRALGLALLLTAATFLLDTPASADQGPGAPVRLGAVEELLQYLLIGIARGAVFSLIALGYTMVYGIIELINFAHGDLYMLGAFMALSVVACCGGESLSGGAAAGAIALAFLVSTAFTAGVNFGVERLAYRPLRNAPPLAPLLTAIGMSFIFQNLGLFWGGLPIAGMGSQAAAPKSFPDLLPTVNLVQALGIPSGLSFTTKDLFVIATAAPLMVGLTLFVRFTRLGKAMRATAQNRMAAQVVGINADRVIAATFLIGGGLAGAGAVINGLYNNTIVFDMGYNAGLMAFTAAVLGGIGSIPGAMLGGFFIGIVSSFSDWQLATQWTPAVVFGLLILVLIFRPQGLLGRETGEKA
ncbi:MAG: branched-chain amino acid ABC transporter permease [Planctomycetales bacterium]|nr:branched-chain amino acid ABC transporter permease [Planctomycetales bacterium]